MTWSDREGWCSIVLCDDSRVVDEKEREVGWRWKRCGGLWVDLRNQGYNLPDWVGSPHIGVITHQIRNCTWCIGEGKLTCTGNSLKSQFLTMISPICSHLSLSCPQFYHHIRIQSLVIALYLSMPWSSVNTEYRIHWVQHTPSTPYTEYSIHQVQHTLSTAYIVYCIIRRSTVFHSQPVSHLWEDNVILNYLHSDNYQVTNK